MKKALFLDVDGVLNDHAFDADPHVQSSTLLPECVARLNRVLDETGCEVVISSAWRYMILGGAMTLDGFAYVLRTHGVRIKRRIAGYTRKDLDIKDLCERGTQVREWLAEHPEFTVFAVVDDLSLGFEGLPFVKTDGEKGMSDADADALISMLGVV